jgi:hypothetical protein
VVVEISDKDIRCWNVPWIKEVFDEREAAEICQISISFSMLGTQQIWMCTRNIDFTMRSAYHLDKTLATNDTWECSYVTKQCTIWKIIWKMIVPNAIRVFMWTTCKNDFSIKANLIKRKVEDDPFCPICGIVMETTWHMLWSCPAARDTWSMCGRRLQKCSVKNEEFIHIVEEQ